MTDHDKQANLRKVETMVSSLCSVGADLIVLPEFFNCIYEAKYFRENAESFPGQTTDFISRLAAEKQVCIVAGSIPESDSNLIFNTCYVFDDQGGKIAKYRKIHLFDINIPNQITFMESNTISPGAALTTFTYRGITFGISICYDIRFPELYRLYASLGVEVLIVPAAFSAATGKKHWSLLFRSRAIDNQFFVIAASPANNLKESYHIWGHSMAVDPWGEILCEADENEQTLLVDLDLSIIEKVRRESPFLQHRRDDLYSTKWRK